jgi:hypothetical protein
VAAVITVSAGDVMEHDYAIADAELANALPHFRDDA